MYVLQRKKRMKFDCCFIGKGENDSDTESIPNTSMISYMWVHKYEPINAEMLADVVMN